MATISTHIVIAAPVDRVWHILIDLSNYAAWNSYLVRVDGEARAGAQLTVHSVPRPGMEAVAAPVQVISVDPYAMRWEGGLPDRNRFKGDHWFRLSETEAGDTLFTHEEHFSGSEADAILGQYGTMIEAAFHRFNADLKAATAA
jgi:hypothetical protein